MADGRPSERGIVEVADDSGNVIKGVNRLRLGPGLSASYNAADPSVVIDAVGGSAVSVNLAVDNVSALRALSSIVMLVARVAQTSGYSSVGDGGGATYDWVSGNTDADDGALTIKVTAVTTGRWKFRMPADGIFPLASCSIAGDGSTHVGSALTTLALKLYTAGYYGMRGIPGRRYNLTSGAYDIPPRVEKYPWRHYGIEFCGDNAAAGLSSSITANLTIESGHSGSGVDYPIAVLPYGQRTWTSTIYAGARTFNSVSDIRNLSVGDPLLVRCGADPTDASGPWYTHHFCKILSITPTTGNAGNIVVDDHVDETPINPMPSYNVNLLRTPTQHDLMKITGFQDNLLFDNCTFDDVAVNPSFSRNLVITNPVSRSCALGFALFGCIATKITNPWYQKVIGINLSHGDPVTDPGANYGSWLLLNVTRDTEIRNLRIDRLSVSGGIMNSELQSRQTVFSGFTNVKFSIDQGGPLPLCGSFIDNSSHSIINVEHFTADGGGGAGVSPPSVNVRFGTLVLGKNDAALGSSDPTAPQSLFVRSSSISGSLIFRGNEYRTRKHCVVLCTGISATSTKTFPIPYNGIVRNVRVYSSAVTGIDHWYIRGQPVEDGTDQVTNLVAGQWVDLQDPPLLVYGSQNFYNDIQYVKIVTNGTWNTSGYFIVDLEIMQNNGNKENLDSISDSSKLPYRVSSGAPSASADFIGQENLDNSAGDWYKAVSIGSGSSDWKKITP